jgi:hypothetical protein
MVSVPGGKKTTDERPSHVLKSVLESPCETPTAVIETRGELLAAKAFRKASTPDSR